MTPERWHKIEELFQSARKRETAGERAAFLDGACASDAELRTQVEALLKAEDSAGSFINTSAVKVAAGIIAADRAAEMQGRTISHYKITSAIGAGGMGEVYLATDTRSGRKVALKLLPDHLIKDAERVRRFQQEARAVLALNHPNIVTVYEIGQEAGTQFIASEFVKGDTLRARQAGGVPVDERTDIWSLGVVIYEMIAGRVPFDGETPSDCIAAILDKEPPSLTRYARNVPETLEVIVSTALTKDRDERYHSVKELLGALRRLKQRLDATAELERSVAPQTRGVVAENQSREATASKTGEAVPATQPIIHSTSSAEYIVSE